VCAAIAIYFLTNLILKTVGQGIGTPAEVLFAPQSGPQFQKDVKSVWSVVIVEFPLTLFSLHFDEGIQAMQMASLQDGTSLTNAVNVTALWDTAYVQASGYTGNIIIPA
jgi:hypothetical protein